MLDIETRAPLRVSVDGDAGPYLMFPLDQLPDVRRVLGENGITYAIEEDAIQLDDKLAIAIIDFDLDADVAHIQSVLDAA
jgi:hypothetical protein